MTTTETIDTWLNGIIVDLIDNYNRLGLRASGRWAESLESFIDNNVNSIIFGVKGESYTQQMEQGRGITKKSNGGILQGIIRKWIDIKGIVPKDNITLDQLASAITWKIHKKGIKVPNQFNAGGLVSSIVTKPRIEEVVKQIGIAKLNEIKSTLITQFKNGSN